MSRRSFQQSSTQLQRGFKETNWAIYGFAGLVAIVAFLYSFFLDRPIGADEAGLYNPIYNYLQFGQMAYPAHGVEHINAMFVHPPVHYLEIALLMKLGLSLFQATGIPLFGLTLFSCVIVCQGKFSAQVKLGLLFGLFSTAFIWSWIWSVRPDLHLALAWFAGLVTLESARLDDWKPEKLLLGSFLLSYASGLHYIGVLGFIGILVYAGWLLFQFGLIKARLRLLFMLLGASLFWLPYLVWFVIPNWQNILIMTRAVQGSGGLLKALGTHQLAYSLWDERLSTDWQYRPITAAITFPILRARIPAALVAPILLWLQPSARGIALACLPQTLFILFLTQGKSWNTGYYAPEFIVYTAGVVILVALLMEKLITKITPQLGQQTTTFFAIALLAIAITQQVPKTLETLPRNSQGYTTLFPDQFQVPLHLNRKELEVARATSKALIGSNQLVGTNSVNLWYTAGGDDVYYITSDFLYPPDISQLDLTEYFAQFDALPQDIHTSNLTWNKQRLTLSKLYENGVLDVKGFFFGDRHFWSESELSYLTFSVQKPNLLTGYGIKQGNLYKFEAQPLGDHTFVTAICVASSLTNNQLKLDFFSTLLLPDVEFDKYTGALSAESQVLRSFLMPQKQYQFERESITKICKIRNEIDGSIVKIDSTKMLSEMSKEDRKIKFHWSLSSALKR
jgi:hypothetical protein